MYMHSPAACEWIPTPRHPACTFAVSCPGAFAGAAGQWVSHTQAEIRRGRWGFLPPVLCFKFVMAGRPWAGHAAVLILVAGSQNAKASRGKAETGKAKQSTALQGLCAGKITGGCSTARDGHRRTRTTAEISCTSSLFSAKVKRLECRLNFLQEERGQSMSTLLSSFSFSMAMAALLDTIETAGPVFKLQVRNLSTAPLHATRCNTCMSCRCRPVCLPAPLFIPGSRLPTA